jgi:hypothetical protein
MAPQAVYPLPSTSLDGRVYQLLFAHSRQLVHTFASEGAALALLRDIVRVRGHRDAAQFELCEVRNGVPQAPIATGDDLVRRAVEDRVL